MKRRECKFWAEVEAAGGTAGAAGPVREHLLICRRCRSRLLEEERLTRLLDDLLSGYRAAAAPAFRPETAPFSSGGPVPRLRPGVAAAALAGGVLIFLLAAGVLFQAVRRPEIARIPESRYSLSENRLAVAVGEGERPPAAKRIRSPRSAVPAGPAGASAGAGDFGNAFWAEFDRAVSAAAFPQEVRDLSGLSWPGCKSVR